MDWQESGEFTAGVAIQRVQLRSAASQRATDNVWWMLSGETILRWSYFFYGPRIEINGQNRLGGDPSEIYSFLGIHSFSFQKIVGQQFTVK